MDIGRDPEELSFSVLGTCPAAGRGGRRGARRFRRAPGQPPGGCRAVPTNGSDRAPNGRAVTPVPFPVAACETIVPSRGRTPRGQLRHLHVTRLDPSSLRLDVIADAGDPRIAAVAALDRDLFGPHQSLDEAALRALLAAGGLLFVHQDPGGELVTEAALVLGANPAGPSALDRRLPPGLGYCDGAAVAPAWRRKGLQQALLRAREEAARARGLEGLCASVRHGNLASVRAMARRGFAMAVDSPRHFGRRPQDARVVMLKMFEWMPDAEPARAVPPGPALAPAQVAPRVADRCPVIELAARQGDAVDPVHDAAVASLLRAGYLGVACVPAATGGGTFVLRFVRGDTLAGPGAARLRAAQVEVQALVDGDEDRVAAGA